MCNVKRQCLHNISCQLSWIMLLLPLISESGMRSVGEMSFVTDVHSITPSSQTVSAVASALTQPFLQSFLLKIVVLYWTFGNVFLFLSNQEKDLWSKYTCLKLSVTHCLKGVKLSYLLHVCVYVNWPLK